MLYTIDGWFEEADFPFHIVKYFFKPDETIPPHSHEFVEMVYVQQGKGQHTYRGQSYIVEEGDIFVIEPNAEHSYEAHDPDFTVVNIMFDSPLLHAELNTLSAFTSFLDFFYVEPFFRSYSGFQSRLVLTGPNRIEMTAYLNKLESEFVRRDLGYRIVLKTKMIELLVFLSRCYDRQANTALNKLQNDREVFDQILRFIDLHCTQPLSLDQISRLCGMSSTAFSVKFKQRTGKTFIEYRNLRRIDSSLALLTQTDEKIISIAEKIGFEDLSFFNKTFKQAMNCTPSDYRKNGRMDK